MKSPLRFSPCVNPEEKSNVIFKKRVYVKFSLENLLKLKKLYEKMKYPSKTAIRKLSLATNESDKKIENWFKHKRRFEMNNGTLTTSKKKIFSQHDKIFLTEKFLNNKNPTYGEYKLISKEIDCPIKNLRNWFSYKRKLFHTKNKELKAENRLSSIKNKSTPQSKESYLKQEEKEVLHNFSEKIEHLTQENCNSAIGNMLKNHQMMNEYHRINYQNALMSYNQNIFNQYYSQQVQIAQQFVYNNNPNLQQQHFAYNNNPNFKQH